MTSYRSSKITKGSLARSLFLKLALGALLLVGGGTLAFYSVEKDYEIRQFKVTDSQRVKVQVEAIYTQIGHNAADVILAADFVNEILVEEDRDLEGLNRKFSSLLWSVRNFEQLRLIGSDGFEIVRVDRGPRGPILHSRPNLQNKSHRPYFLEAIGMEPGEIYVSHLDLNRENGKLQTPLSPVLRIATPVFLDAAKSMKAIVVANCSIEKLLKLDRTISNRYSGKMLMMNSGGYWIHGLEEADEWGYLLPDRDDKTVEHTFPEDWPILRNSLRGQFVGTNGLFTFESVTPSKISIGEGRSEILKHSELHNIDGGGALCWKIISYVSNEELGAEIAAATKATFLVALGILAFLLVGCWYVSQSVSYRKRALEELERNEAISSSIIKTAMDGIIIINEHGIMQSFNETASRMFGYEAEQAVGHNVTMLMPDAYAQGHDQKVRAAARGASLSNRKVIGVAREVQGCRSDGTLFPLELSVSSFEVQGQRMFTGVVRDITKRRESAAEIELLALFPKHNPNPLARFDANGSILNANPAAKNLWGLEDSNPRYLPEIITDISAAELKLCVESGRVFTRDIIVQNRHFIVLLKGIPTLNVGQLYAFDVQEQREGEMASAELGRILDNSVNEVYLTDLQEMTFVMVNRNACTNLGYELDELLKMSPMDIKPAQLHSATFESLVEPLLSAEKDVILYCTKHSRKDGSTYDVELTIQLSTFKAKPVFVTFAVDISARVAAEQERIMIEKAYKAEEIRRRDLINNLFERVSRKTGDALFHELTSQLSDKLEMDYALVGEFTGNDNQRVQAHSLFANGGTSTDYSYDLIGTPCGDTVSKGFCSCAAGAQELYPEDSALVDLDVEGYIGAQLSTSDGRPIGILLVMSSSPIEYLEFKESVVKIFAARAASELQRIQDDRHVRRLARAVEGASDIVIITDSDAKITYVNPAFERITGYSSQEAIGEKPRLLRSGKQDDKFYENVWSDIRTEGSWNGSIVNKKKDGALYTAEVSITAIKDDNGKLTSFVALQRDVTAQRESERRLRQAQKMGAVGALAGGIAHDFNNILMGITGFTEMVCDELPKDSPLVDDLKEALAAGSRAKELVQQILRFSRRSEKTHSPLKMYQVVEEALKLIEATLPGNVTLEKNISNNSGLIMADSMEIHQIVMNLCTNASHAIGDKRGSLSVSLEQVALGDTQEYDVASLPSGEYLRLTVSDTGCGIDADTKARMFEPFFTTKKAGAGTGMGLSTVYGIVQECDGDIVVESEEGRGSSFDVYFPLYSGSDIADSKRVSVEFKGNERILIAEDNEPSLRVTCRMLKKLGYNVTGKLDPVEAVATFRMNPSEFDLIITDKSMPEMSGMELAQKIREVRSDIPVLLLTAYAESLTRESAEGLGFAALLLKPVDAYTLGAEIQKALKNKLSNATANLA